MLARGALLLGLLSLQGCQQYSDRDVELLSRYGGDYVLSGEAWARYQAPVGAVYLTKRNLSDEEFASAFPALKQMDPMVLLIRGDHGITDQSVPLLNKLQAVEHLDVSGTRLTLGGLRTLRLRHLRQLVVSPGRLTEEEANALRKHFPTVEVTRWEPADAHGAPAVMAQ